MKSAQFPLTGIVTSGYHTPGVEIVGQAVKQNEKVISIDDLLYSAVSFYDLDLAKNHYEYRSKYTEKMGMELSYQMDSRLQRIVALAARNTSPNIAGVGYAGERIVDAAMKTDKAVIKSALRSAAQKFDEKNVPSEGRHAVLSPAQYYLLLQDDEVVNSRYDVGGSVKNGTFAMIYGIHIHVSNAIPSTVVAAATGENNTYSGDFTTTAGLVFHEEAAGTVKLMDLSTEMERSVSRQSTLVVAKYACGHGELRRECAIELATDDVA
jgi:N4-gp56 family major capsid protein